jgi:RNA exonuclease 1
MGTAANGDTELIRLTAIDFFSKETLIDNLVKPKVHMWHLNTRYSGVSWKGIAEAERRRTCFFSKYAARQALLKYVGPETVIVAHSGYNDFTALRWIHPKVVDTFIMWSEHKKHEEEVKKLELDERAAERLSMSHDEYREWQKNEEVVKKLALDEKAAGALGMTVEEFGIWRKNQALLPAPVHPFAENAAKVRRAPGGLSLKALVKKHANIDIQTGYGHDSLEDALACRELALAFIEMTRMENRPKAAKNLPVIPRETGLGGGLGMLKRQSGDSGLNDQLTGSNMCNGEVSGDLISFDEL